MRTLPVDLTFRQGTGDEQIPRIAISSEFVVSEWFGDEILEHSATAVDLTHFTRAGIPLRVVEHADGTHEKGETIGILLDPEIGPDRVLRGTPRFSKSARAQEVRQDLVDGIRPYVSVGFRRQEWKIEQRANGQPDLYRVTKWRPLEASLVPVPSDATVGVGRAAGELLPVRVQARTGEGERPFGDYASFDDCVAQNADKEDPAAYCATIQAQMEGAAGRPPSTQEEGRQMAAERNEGAAAGTQAGTDDRSKESDVRSFDVKITERERQRVSALTGLAIEWNRTADLKQWIDEGRTPDQVREVLLVGMKQGAIKPPVIAPAAEHSLPELSQDERKRYSIARAMLSMIPGETVEAGLETEVHRSLCDVFGDPPNGGMWVGTTLKSPAERAQGTALAPTAPRSNLQRYGSRQLVTNVSGSGQELVFTEPGEFIELLRARAMVMRLGATVLDGLVGNVGFPRQTGAASGSWVAEDPGADVADSLLTLDIPTLSPNTYQASTSFTRQLLRQALRSISVEQLVRDDLVKVHALAIDLAALRGTGGTQPQGILTASGVNVISAGTPNGGALTWAIIVDCETQVAADNADIGVMAYLTTPAMRGKAKTKQKDTGSGLFFWDMDGSMNGYRAEVSTQVPSNLTEGTLTNGHALYFGVWSQCVIGEWGALELIVDPYRLKKQGIIEVTSFHMYDVLLRHPQSFAVVNDIDPAL